MTIKIWQSKTTTQEHNNNKIKSGKSDFSVHIRETFSSVDEQEYVILGLISVGVIEHVAFGE